MSDKVTRTDLAARQEHLRRVVIKECDYLLYTVEKLSQVDPQFNWLDALEQNAELLVPMLEIVTKKFCQTVFKQEKHES